MNIIKDLRKERKMTLTALAHSAGVSIPYLFDLERGRRGATEKTACKIAEALNVEVEELQLKDSI